MRRGGFRGQWFGRGGALAVGASASGHGLERCGGLRRLAALFAPALLIALAMLYVAGFTLVPESSAASAGRSVLIVAPHPDDDILYGAGVAANALAHGDTVKIVYMTNGDLYGLDVGLTRENEAVSAQTQFIGTSEDDLIFLGYPDGYLASLLDAYPSSGDVLTTTNGQSATYGDRGLGLTEYHDYRFGSHADYNGASVLQDLDAILATYRPDDVYTTFAFDAHPDHATTYIFVHWADDSTWPASMDPQTDMVEPPNLSETGLSWNARESLEVPLAMQSTNLDTNPKYLALNEHQSQGGASGNLDDFIHRDEVFWIDDLTNHPPTADAGLAQTVTAQSLVQLDGSASSDPDGDLLTYAWTQTAGPAVTLSDAGAARPGFTAPADAASLSFQLVVDDGQVASSPASVTITVTPTPPADVNIAAQAALTASSQSSVTSQLAAKAVDGSSDGYPGDYTREWASLGEKAGAWLQLTWPGPFVVGRIVLHDRPNANDQITAATLRFSDGSSLTTGALPNDGTALTLDFPARTVTSVQLSIDAANPLIHNIGLAEIEVYGQAP